MGKRGPKPRPMQERFWAKVEKTGHGGCWIWTGMVWDGYPLFNHTQGEPAVMCRRFAWEQCSDKPVPPQVTACPKNSRCVRPGKGHVQPRALRRPGEAYQLRMSGLAYHEIGQRLGVTRQRVQQLLHQHYKKTGKHYGAQAVFEHLNERIKELEAD